MFCGNCGKEVQEGIAFCPSCGSKFNVATANTAQGTVHNRPPEPSPAPEIKPVFCGNCGKQVQEGSPFCPNCGSKANVAAETAAAVQNPEPSPAPEIKPVFCGNCGKQVQEGSPFCPNCGTKAGAGNAAQDATPAGNRQQYQQSTGGFVAKKNPWQYFTGVIAKYAVFKGRARRAELWWFVLFSSIVYFLASVIDVNLDLQITEYYGVLNLLCQLVWFLPTLGVSIRRMHDCDKSGWFILVPIYNIILLFTNGTGGPNRFGPDPKAGNYN